MCRKMKEEIIAVVEVYILQHKEILIMQLQYHLVIVCVMGDESKSDKEIHSHIKHLKFNKLLKWERYSIGNITFT